MQHRDRAIDKVRVFLYEHRASYSVHADVIRDMDTQVLMVNFSLWSMDPTDPLDPVFTHNERCDEFPSDHLMTKLILLVG